MSKLDISNNQLCGVYMEGRVEYGMYDASGLQSLSQALASIQELNISPNLIQAEGARILAEDIKDMGALSKLIFSGGDRESKEVTVEVGMPELDCSGAILQAPGATILAAWLEHK